MPRKIPRLGKGHASSQNLLAVRCLGSLGVWLRACCGSFHVRSVFFFLVLFGGGGCRARVRVFSGVLFLFVVFACPVSLSVRLVLCWLAASQAASA